MWEAVGLPASQGLADALQHGRVSSAYLNAPQLLKHALGLATGSRRFGLLYLWYDVDGPVAETHAAELADFAGRGDGNSRFARCPTRRSFARSGRAWRRRTIRTCRISAPDTSAIRGSRLRTVFAFVTGFVVAGSLSIVAAQSDRGRGRWTVGRYLETLSRGTAADLATTAGYATGVADGLAAVVLYVGNSRNTVTEDLKALIAADACLYRRGNDAASLRKAADGILRQAAERSSIRAGGLGHDRIGLLAVAEWSVSRDGRTGSFEGSRAWSPQTLRRLRSQHAKESCMRID